MAARPARPRRRGGGHARPAGALRRRRAQRATSALRGVIALGPGRQASSERRGAGRPSRRPLVRSLASRAQAEARHPAAARARARPIAARPSANPTRHRRLSARRWSLRARRRRRRAGSGSGPPPAPPSPPPPSRRRRLGGRGELRFRALMASRRRRRAGLASRQAAGRARAAPASPAAPALPGDAVAPRLLSPSASARPSSRPTPPRRRAPAAAAPTPPARTSPCSSRAPTSPTTPPTRPRASGPSPPSSPARLDAGAGFTPASGSQRVLWAEVASDQPALAGGRVITVAAAVSSQRLPLYLAVSVRHDRGQPLALLGYPALRRRPGDRRRRSAAAGARRGHRPGVWPRSSNASCATTWPAPAPNLERRPHRRRGGDPADRCACDVAERRPDRLGRRPGLGRGPGHASPRPTSAATPTR